MMLTALRIANIIVWAVLFACAVPGALATIRGKDVRRSDPWHLSVALVSLVIVLSNVRFLFWPESESLFRGIYMLMALVGIYKIVLARTYGRGPRL